MAITGAGRILYQGYGGSIAFLPTYGYDTGISEGVMLRFIDGGTQTKLLNGSRQTRFIDSTVGTRVLEHP